MNLDDVISLADAATTLGLAQSTLRNQAVAGRIRARLVGKTWVTTRQEVERYRREQLGQIGRPPAIEPEPAIRRPPAIDPERKPSGHSKWSTIKRTRSVETTTESEA